jgi:SPP1 gp7 family putative phage head morphogenesis protein
MKILPQSVRSYALRQFGALVAKSFGSASWARGDDLDGISAATRLVAPYAQSTWVMRAIRLKLGELANAPVHFYRGEVEFEEAAFSAFWAAPFLGRNGQRLPLAEGEEWLGTWLDLEGEAFLIQDDVWLTTVGRVRTPSPLIIAPPRCMRHVVQGGKLLGWVYTDAGGRQHNLIPEQVVHRMLPNPYDDWRGMTPLDPMRNAVEADVAAGQYVRNLMRNNGDQGVYVVAKDGAQLTQPQQDQIAAVLAAKRSARMRGQFIPTFLGGNIEITDPKAQAPDANLNATRLGSRHEIFIGLGVPASMADVQASYSVGSASDRYQLITGTCQPLGRLLCGMLSPLATRTAGVAIEAEHDWDDHQVMQEVRRGRADVALKFWGAGMPMKAVSDYLDLGLPQYPGWDRGYLPFSVTEVGAPEATPATDPALSELPETGDQKPEGEEPADEDTSVAALRCLILARGRRSALAPVARAERDPKEVALWSQLIQVRRQAEKQYKSRLGRELIAARAEVLRKIESAYQPTPKSASDQSQIGNQKSKIEQRSAATDLLFDLSKFTEGLVASFRKQSALSLQASGEHLYEELGRDDPFTYPPADVLEFVRSRESKISGASEAVYSRIKETLEEGITAGDTTAELAARVKAEFNGIDSGRAFTIAQTEAGAAYANGRAVAMETAGIEWKQWLTSGNPSVRPAHAEANGQIRKLTEPFEVGGEELDHPGAETGSPENVINCHCVSIPVEGPASDGKARAAAVARILSNLARRSRA